MSNKIIWVYMAILGFLALIFGYWLTAGFWTSSSFSPLETGLPVVDFSTTAAKTKIKSVSSEKLTAYWLDEDGRLYSMKPSGAVIGVSSRKLSGINQVMPAPGGRKALVGFNYPDSLKWTIIDAVNQNWIALPSGTLAAAWHPMDDNQVVYLQNGGLRILNLKSNRSRLILKINLTDIVLEWPEENKIWLVDRPTALAAGKIWEVNLKKKTFKKIDEGKGLMVKTNGHWRLRFTGSINHRGDRLILIRDGGAVLADVGSLLEGGKKITLPTKCVFSRFKIYCAVPREISPAVTLPDDYLKRKFVSTDDFYVIVINPQAGVETGRWYSPPFAVDAVDLRLTQDNKLYFLNRRDRKLYYLELD